MTVGCREADRKSFDLHVVCGAAKHTTVNQDSGSQLPETETNVDTFSTFPTFKLSLQPKLPASMKIKKNFKKKTKITTFPVTVHLNVLGMRTESVCFSTNQTLRCNPLELWVTLLQTEGSFC